MGSQPALQLPRRSLGVTLTNLRAAGASVAERDLPATDWQDFETAGMDARDYQQEYLIDGVKVSFFVPDEPLAAVLSPGTVMGPRLATVDELFQTKVLVAAKRSKTRDWFDLHYLMKERGYTMEDFVRVFEQVGDKVQVTIALRRLCSGQPGIADEGFAALTSHAPSSSELTEYFVRERDRWETQQAARAGEVLAAQRPATQPPPPSSQAHELWPEPGETSGGQEITPQ